MLIAADFIILHSTQEGALLPKGLHKHQCLCNWEQSIKLVEPPFRNKQDSLSFHSLNNVCYSLLCAIFSLQLPRKLFIYVQ